MGALTWERTEANGELLVAVNDTDGAETGATVVVRLRDGETANSYLDFSDGVFKTVGWTTIDGAMTEVTTGGTLGIYRRAIDLTALTLPSSDRLIAEYRVTAPTGFPQDVDTLQLVNHYQDVAVATDILSDATAFQGADVAAILVDTAALDGRLPTDPADESLQQAAHTQTQADIAALNDLDSVGVQTGLTAQGYTAARAPNLDNLDAAVTSRAAPGAAMDLIADAVDATSLADGAITDAKMAADVDSFQAKIWLIDDDTGSADKYKVAWHKNGEPVLAGVTVPTIRVFQANAAGTVLFAAAAMTQAGAEGVYFHDETVSRIGDGTGYFALAEATIETATRTWVQPVGRDS